MARGKRRWAMGWVGRVKRIEDEHGYQNPALLELREFEDRIDSLSGNHDHIQYDLNE